MRIEGPQAQTIVRVGKHEDKVRTLSARNPSPLEVQACVHTALHVAKRVELYSKGVRGMVGVGGGAHRTEKLNVSGVRGQRLEVSEDC